MASADITEAICASPAINSSMHHKNPIAGLATLLGKRSSWCGVYSDDPITTNYNNIRNIPKESKSDVLRSCREIKCRATNAPAIVANAKIAISISDQALAGDVTLSRKDKKKINSGRKKIEKVLPQWEAFLLKPYSDYTYRSAEKYLAVSLEALVVKQVSLLPAQTVDSFLIEQQKIREREERAAEEKRQRAAEVKRQRAAEKERQRAAEEERQRAAEEERQLAAEAERQRAAAAAVEERRILLEQRRWKGYGNGVFIFVSLYLLTAIFLTKNYFPRLIGLISSASLCVISVIFWGYGFTNGVSTLIVLLASFGLIIKMGITLLLPIKFCAWCGEYNWMLFRPLRKVDEFRYSCDNCGALTAYGHQSSGPDTRTLIRKGYIELRNAKDSI